MLFLIRCFVSIIFISILPSCTSVGEVDPQKIIPLAGTGKARITGESEYNHGLLNGLDQKIGITHLDGKSLWRMGVKNDFPESLLIAPGKHQIGVRYMYMNVFSDGTLWLNVENEKSYIIRKKTHRYSVSFWIEDVATGKIVGSAFGEEEKQEQKIN